MSEDGRAQERAGEEAAPRRALPAASGGAAHDLDALHVLERELEEEWQRLQLEGHGASGLRALLEEDKDGERLSAAAGR